jgi:hypothetical protein
MSIVVRYPEGEKLSQHIFLFIYLLYDSVRLIGKVTVKNLKLENKLESSDPTASPSAIFGSISES